jgi:hypothetical protein
MGRHTFNLSDDWSACGRCKQKLNRGVCMCCGSGFTHVCSICIKTKKGKWNMAIGDNKGCDKHLQKGDIRFPKEFPKCEHVIAEEKARIAGW